MCWDLSVQSYRTVSTRNRDIAMNVLYRHDDWSRTYLKWNFPTLHAMWTPESPDTPDTPGAGLHSLQRWKV